MKSSSRWQFLLFLVISASVSAGIFAQVKPSIDRAILNDKLAGKLALVSDLETLQKVARLGDASPIGVIGPNNLQVFIDSAVFSEFGLASFDARVLEGLNLTDAYRFLQLFGWEQYTLSFLDLLEVRSQLDQELASKLKQDAIDYCPGYEPQGGAVGTDIRASQDGSARCYDPRCSLRNNTCSSRASCTPFTGATCNICRC